MPGGHYAPGNKAWGLCQKCGLRYLLHELVFDGYYPELRVCTGCYDDRQPQEFLIDVTDPQALWKPSPEDAPIAPVVSIVVVPGVPTSLLLNMDGVNGSTNFPDSSFYDHTMAVISPCAVSTANPKFGTGA